MFKHVEQVKYQPPIPAYSMVISIRFFNDDTL
jgi:hypothetical protein